MKLINYYRDSGVHLAIKTPKGIIDVDSTSHLQKVKSYKSIEHVISSGKDALSDLENLASGGLCYFLDENKLCYAPPILNPQKILCVGLNYADHQKECDNFEKPTVPVLFSKFSNTIASHMEIIPLCDNIKKHDYEAELAIIIGKTCKNVTPDFANEYIFGYSIANDLSARDLQFVSSQWLIGKSFDKACPIGPCVVTADSINPKNLDISLTLNGELRQHSNTKNMIFSPCEIVSYASKIMTLTPGDIILTGTPSGVILGKNESEQVWLKKGDKIDITIENIGTLSNTMG